MRKIAERYLVGAGVATSGKIAHDFEKNPIAVGSYVFYDPVTGKTVGAGVTYAQVPKLGIAQACDLNGDGMTDVLRPIYGNTLDGNNIEHIKVTVPTVGVNAIHDVFFKCTKKDTTYSLNFEWRNQFSTMTEPSYNHWSGITVSVNLSDLQNCDSCEDGIDGKAVSCAFKNAFYGTLANDPMYGNTLDSRNSGMLLNMLAAKRKHADIEVMPILAKEVQYCISMVSGDCDTCDQMASIGGITLVGDGTNLEDDVTVTFGGTTVSGDNTKSWYAQKDRILTLINKAFEDNNVAGSAVVIEQIQGAGRQCASIKILINSCISVSLLDGAGDALTPCVAEYSPYQTFTNQAHCLGCGTGSTFTPTSGVRIVGKAIMVNSTDMPVPQIGLYHTDVRITTGEYSNFTNLYHYQMQASVPPQNLGIQFAKGFLNQNVTGPGFNYSPDRIEHRGVYQRNYDKNAMTLNLHGLNVHKSYWSISIAHSLESYGSTAVDNPVKAKANSFLLIEATDTDTRTAVKAVLDPWLASLPNPRAALDFTPVEDIQMVVNATTGAMTTEPGDVTGVK